MSESLTALDGVAGDRFELQRRLGVGSFGVVYEAFDRERDCQVALKTLKNADAGSLYYLKQEFRSLADISHPYLVSFYELLSDGEEWFITMELVEGGRDFLQHVRGGEKAEILATSDETLASDMELGDVPDSDETMILQPGPVVATRADIPVLRSALRQVAEGISALHAEDKLHRDIKPSNVLVSSAGQVTILDFGLVHERSPEWAEQTVHVAGTPIYMAPEQARGSEISAASDWYAVGVMLFEALVGRPPFSGSPSQIVAGKEKERIPLPSTLASGVPEDLDQLCVELLRVRPEDRPSGRKILERLGGEADQAPATASSAADTASEGLFVGRAAQLEELADAFALSNKGASAIAFVHGVSGMGKTVLVHHFLADLARRHRDAVVLAGRCYERESVPYKAVDSVVDSLSQYLRSLKRAEVDSLLPRDLLALTRLFPVLNRVEAVAGARRRVVEISDSRELRRRAFGALREMLGRLSEQHPLVVFIDGLQWGDQDSAALLADVLRPPDPPALLLIATYRSDEVDTSPSLKSFLELAASPEARSSSFEIEVGELTPEESRDLARRLLAQQMPGESSRAEDIAREASGNPFFLEKLVTATAVSAEASGSSTLMESRSATTLGNMLRRLVYRMPEPAQQLLRVLAVIGRPVELAAASSVAELEGEALAALNPLTAAKLVRTRTTEQGEAVEIYHDRIRETVFETVPASALPRLHKRIFEALCARGSADPEALAVHAQGAGDAEQAAFYAGAAAENAAEALAFDRAARLYRLALDLRGAQGDADGRMRIALAEALVNAGRGAEAAAEFLAAAALADPTEAVELRRLAAQNYLVSGHLDEGLETVQSVLAAQGMELPASPGRALLSILIRRVWLRVRGLRYRRRSESELTAAELTRIDSCWTVAQGLFLSNTISAMAFQNRGLLLALKAGEPKRLARALSLELVQVGTSGSRAAARSDKLIAFATGVAAQAQQKLAEAFVTLYSGYVKSLSGLWSEGRELSDRAEGMFRKNRFGVAWEIDNCHVGSMYSLLRMGELGELASRVPAVHRDAEERGDLFMATYLETDILPRLHLAAGEAEKALEVVSHGIGRWPYPGFHRQHQYALHAGVEIRLYLGDGAGAWALVEEQYPALKRSLILRAQMNRIVVADYRARSAIAATLGAADEATKKALLASAAKDAALIEKEKAAWGVPLAAVLRAGIAEAVGSAEAVADLLQRAERGFDAAQMGLNSAAVRLRRGQALGGEKGQALVDDAGEWMRGQGIINPAGWARMLVPGVGTDDAEPQPPTEGQSP